MFKNWKYPWWFHLSWFLPLIASGFSFWIVSRSYNLDWRLDAEGLEYFFQIFKYPIYISGLNIILPTLAIAIYRAEKQYDQIEIQLKQQKQSDYYSFKNEYLEYFDSENVTYKNLEINPRAIFKSLYPGALNADHGISPDFSAFVYEDFLPGFTELNQRLHSRSVEAYDLVYYRYIHTWYSILRRIIPISTKGIENSDNSLSGKLGTNLKEIASDILVFVHHINTFEGEVFFSYIEWRNLNKAFLYRFDQRMNEYEDAVNFVMGVRNVYQENTVLYHTDINSFLERLSTVQIVTDYRNKEQHLIDLAIRLFREVEMFDTKYLIQAIQK